MESVLKCKEIFGIRTATVTISRWEILYRERRRCMGVNQGRD